MNLGQWAPSSGFVGSRRQPVKIAPPAPQATIMPVPGQTIIHLPISIPYYDPSRIFKDIKVVADMRQQGTERGEVQTGDNGILGPGSSDASQIAPPQTGLPAAPGTVGKNNLVPIALAIGAFLLFGG